MSSLSRLFAAIVTLSLMGLACATSSSSAPGGSSTVEDVPNESAPAPKDQRPQTQLQKLTAPEGFTVLFPGQPEAQRSKVAIPGGEVQTASWALNDSGGVLYSISTLDYPEKVVSAHPAAAFFNEGKNGLVNKLKGTIKSEEDITLQGYPGKALTIASDSGEVRARNFLVGPRLYTLLVLYNPSIGAPQADQFLSSLELINPPPSLSPAPKGAGASDGGTPAGDGGTAGDAGTPARDAGSPATDAGMSAADAGTPRK